MRVAIVGAGFAGGIHAQAWSRVSGVEFVVVDREVELARQVAARWGGRPALELGDALAPEIDVVDICLPTALHAELAVTAARAGKHVLCEKPLAMNLAEADRMLAAAADEGVTLMVAHVLRFWPEYDRLRSIADDASLGRLEALACSRLVTRPGQYAPWLIDPAQGLGLAEVAIHDLDIAVAILGRPRSVVANGVRDGAGWSHLQALLRVDGRAVVSIEAGWGTPPSDPFLAGFRAKFERGIVEYESHRRPTLRIARDEGVEESASPEGETEGGPWAFDVAGYLAEVEYFAGCVAAGRPAERCPPQAARQALELSLAVLEAAATGREITLGR
jgi:predicted dehydrogenase